MGSRQPRRREGAFSRVEMRRWGGRALLTLLGISLATFLLLQLLPGDPAMARLASPTHPPGDEAYRQMRHEMGLDRPAGLRYFAWLAGVLRGDLGTSLSDGRPVTARLAERLPASLLLNGLALAVVFGLAVPLGAVMAHRRGSLLDRGSRWLLFLLYAVPGFWMALLLQAAVAVRLGWLPLHGITSTGMEGAGLPARALDVARHLILPVVCLAYGQLAFLTRFTRANVLDALGEDFVRTARAKGLPEATVLRRHAFRNALAPLVTLTGLTLPTLLGGSVLIESIFAWPGAGLLFYEGVVQRDYPVVMALTLLAALLTLAGSLAADLLYRAVDPRAIGVER